MTRKEAVSLIKARLGDIEHWSAEFKERCTDGVLRRDLILFEKQCKVFSDELFILCLKTHGHLVRDDVCQTTAPSTTTGS
ncbi:hypothetical protein LCGC14_0164430 [marine sediment metagenome]|uniref:Uncharacterized protein n=1 Tax=marine sediment metagenome TaxID=412755 RepID=A0A0F9UYL1_9ZZZZ